VAKIARRVRQAGVYFATTDTWERHALFVNTVLASTVVEQIVTCRDRGFYKLHAFALTPEHLHILLTPIWHRSFHDRWIRDAEQFWQAKSYIEQNPVKARLVGTAEQYPWSSTNGKVILDISRYESASG
jgi:putative transposase